MRGGAALAALLLAACAAQAERREMPFEMIEGEPMYAVLPPDAIPAIDEPELVSADEAEEWMAPDEPVLGVVGAGGTAKAYSAWQLDGRAIQGAELGDRLEHVPSVFTTWKQWRPAHPDTLVLAKAEDEREQTASHYADYFADPERLFLDHLGEDLGGIGAKDVVFGVVVDGEALAVTEDLLAAKGIVNAVVGRAPIAFLYGEATGAARAVDRRLGGRVLLAERNGSDDPALLFRDALTGEVHGPDELLELRLDRAYWYVVAHPPRVGRPGGLSARFSGTNLVGRWSVPSTQPGGSPWSPRRSSSSSPSPSRPAPTTSCRRPRRRWRSAPIRACATPSGSSHVRPATSWSRRTASERSPSECSGT